MNLFRCFIAGPPGWTRSSGAPVAVGRGADGGMTLDDVIPPSTARRLLEHRVGGALHHEEDRDGARGANERERGCGLHRGDGQGGRSVFVDEPST